MYRIQNKKVKFIDLGLLNYKPAWDYQEKLFKEIIDSKIANRSRPDTEQLPTENYLLFVEHPNVITLGKSGRKENLLLSQEELKEKNVEYYHINRGGDITYHGPGQIVGYPILDLDNFFTDIHRYLRILEEAIILTLADFGITSGRIDGLTGVWLDHIEQKNPRKICAIGVKTSRWVTMHGFAFNVNTSLEYYKYIVPCGIDDKAVTSLSSELKEDQNMNDVKSLVKKHLVDLFEMELTI